MKTRAPFTRPEPLEARIAPATHTWTGAGADNLWSNAANWTGGSPATDVSGNIDLIFPTNAAQLVVQNDIAALVVDSITFNAAGGTSANGYTLNGNTFTINTSAAGQDPFGIDVVAGVADATNGITQTFNTGITLATSDATFRTAEIGSRLTFNGDINLGGRTLTFDNTAGTFGSGIQGVVISGDVSNGSLIKTGTGTLQLSGDNSYANTTLNNGVLFADTDTALGVSAGTITVNDPGQIKLRNGVTVEKTTLNLNSNTSGGGLGADGNTSNTFRGNIVLMAGAGGVALGAGNGPANAGTRLVIDGVISGATSTLFINGAGVVEFMRDNSYTGITQVNGNQGFTALQLDTPGGLGASGDANRTILSNAGGGTPGGSVWLNFDGTLAEDIDFAGSGVGALGAIRVIGDHDTVVSGNLTFIPAAPWTFGVDEGTLTLTGVIDSQGLNRGLTKIGDGKLILGGTGANVFGGTTSSDAINAGILSVQNTSATPFGNAARTVNVNDGGTLSVGGSVVVPNPVQLNAGGILAGTGTVSTVTSTGGIVSPGASAGRLTTGNVVLDVASTFLVDVNGTGALTDQLRVNGTINLGGAALALAGGFAATPGTKLVLIDNDGADAVSGTFAGLPQGAQVAVGGQVFTISYVGGTGNDVVLTAVTPLSDFALAANGLSATYTEKDGDIVTVKITKGTLAAGNFTFSFGGDNRQQLQRLVLDAADAGANLTITAKRTAAGGDGFANIGYVNAIGVDLGTVRIDGDLGHIDAGVVKSLTVQSLGALGVTSQAAGGTLVSNFTGNLGRLTVKASIHDATLLGTASIGPVKVNGSFLGGRLSAGADLGAVNVRGDIAGTDSEPVIISGFGKAIAPTAGKDLAIKSLKVGGGVESLRVLAGYDLALAGLNADASTGAITVGADWRASTVLVGVSAGADGFAGTADDAKLATGGVRDTAEIFSTIASITIRGQAFGSTAAGDTFGIVAEQITKAKIGKAVLKFDKGARDAVDAFALASTGPGATGLSSDFFLREVTA